ncbi:MAG TPA: PIG-L deacetylase family protein [Chloroflexia bacterium]|nr:PIG-L deacetylase family protein [Chloroflexia bacterium]
MDGERRDEGNLVLMCIFAHPDDESLGTGGTLARYRDEGVDIHLVTATRGERGWFGPPDDYPGPGALGSIREAELEAAAEVLGISTVSFLDYIDGDLDKAPHDEAVSRIVSHIRRVRPHVALTFGPEGSYGHPDHIAISQLATAAAVRAADCTFRDPEGREPHALSKLYYMVVSDAEARLYQQVFGELVMQIDGVERRAVPWPDWMITTRIDTERYWRTAYEAIRCHRSQLPGYDDLLAQPEDKLRDLFGYMTYYRAFSTVNGGRDLETDLFEGLRPQISAPESKQAQQ